MSSVMDAPPPPTCQHPSHPAHKLILVQAGGAQFTCDGCKQGGREDRRYRCQPCDFDLHIQCALAPPVFTHPMFGGRSFTLCRGMADRFCDACGDAGRGAVYHDSQGNQDLHPCCAFLKDSIGTPGGVLQLRSKVGAASCMLCGHNGPRGNFWSYVLYANGGVEKNIHVACMLYADHNQIGADGAGRSRSTSTPQMMTQNPTPSHQMTGYPNFSHQISSPQMTGYPTSVPQMTGYPTFGHQISSPQMTNYPTFSHHISSPQMIGYPTSSPQMTSYSTSSNQMIGNPTSDQMIIGTRPTSSQVTTTGNQPTSSQMMTSNATSSPQMTGNRPASSPQMTGNRPTSSQMTTGTSFIRMMETINAPMELANNSLQLANNVSTLMPKDDVEENGEEDEYEEEEEDDDDYE